LIDFDYIKEKNKSKKMRKSHS